jgi:hypothetical protein
MSFGILCRVLYRKSTDVSEAHNVVAYSVKEYFYQEACMKCLRNTGSNITQDDLMFW